MFLTLAVFFLIGTMVGSFVNVLVLRFGFSERANPRSECPHCGHGIYWYDLLPVVSYFLLRGRCRFCGSALSFQYPVVEFLIGFLFVLSYFLFPPLLDPLSLVTFCARLVFWAAFVAIVAYDIRHTLIPLSFVAFLSVAALAATGLSAWLQGSLLPLYEGILGAIFLGGFFFTVHVVTRGKGMGIGDAYLGFGVGLLLGIWESFDALALGVWVGCLYALLLLFSSRYSLFPSSRRVTMKTELPFAPWLFVGAMLATFTQMSALGVAEWISQFFI